MTFSPVTKPTADVIESLAPIRSVPKVCLYVMRDNLRSGIWKLWKLGGPAEGWAVTYPYEGALFIYYLHGHKLFGKLTSEDLLQAARAEGLSGVKAETSNPAMLRLLQRVGFEIYAHGPSGWCVELEDGR